MLVIEKDRVKIRNSLRQTNPSMSSVLDFPSEVLSCHVQGDRPCAKVPEISISAVRWATLAGFSPLLADASSPVSAVAAAQSYHLGASQVSYCINLFYVLVIPCLQWRT